MKVKKIMHGEGPGYSLYFTCPACKSVHSVNHLWQFNEDYKEPSISPSILVTSHDKKICHIWMTKGKLKFFNDCTHEMAGQKWIDMPEIDESKF